MYRITHLKIRHDCVAEDILGEPPGVMLWMQVLGCLSSHPANNHVSLGAK
jgi:hypothetical protein